MSNLNTKTYLPRLFRPVIHHFPNGTADSLDPAHPDQFVVTAMNEIKQKEKKIMNGK